MRNMVKITAAVLALTMLTSCGQLDDTSKAETKATSATVTTTTLGTWKPSFENATTFTTTTSATTTTTKTTTTKATTTKKVTTTVQNNSNGGAMYYPSQDNNNYNYEDNQPSYNENNGDNDYSYEQPQQTEQTRQTTTTKKEEQPSKPSGNKITQADIDAMKKELQAYANNKANYINNHYTEFSAYGEEFNTLEEFYKWHINKCTPENSSYNNVYTVLFGETDIEIITSNFMNTIDFLYDEFPKTHLAVYIETCPNGLDVCDKPCWAVYFLR